MHALAVSIRARLWSCKRQRLRRRVGAVSVVHRQELEVGTVRLVKVARVGVRDAIARADRREVVSTVARTRTSNGSCLGPANLQREHDDDGDDDTGGGREHGLEERHSVDGSCFWWWWGFCGNERRRSREMEGSALPLRKLHGSCLPSQP